MLLDYKFRITKTYYYKIATTDNELILNFSSMSHKLYCYVNFILRPLTTSYLHNIISHF